MLALTGSAGYDAYDITSAAVFAGSSYDAYSYDDPGTGVAYEGGWRTAADIGPDRLYQMPEGTQFLSPLIIDNPQAAAAYHLNDPSVVIPTGANRVGWEYMFVTQLPNDKADTLADMTSNNQLGFLASFNRGASWTYLGYEGAGWSPSALQLGDKIDVFSHDQFGRVQLMVFGEDGWNSGAAAQLAIDTTTGQPLLAANVSVAQMGGELIMVANGLGANRFGDIVAYKATLADPLRWSPLLSSGPTLISGANELLTPEVHVLAQDVVKISASEDLAHDANGYPNGRPQATSTMQWSIRLSD